MGSTVYAETTEKKNMRNIDRAVSEIRILDYDKAFDFYCKKLGFDIDFEWRHELAFPVYMGIIRSSMYVHLSEHKGNGEPGNGKGMVLLVQDIENYYNELKTRKAVFDQGLKMQPWGSRNFVVKDPFGNRIEVIERKEE